MTARSKVGNTVVGSREDCIEKNLKKSLIASKPKRVPIPAPRLALRLPFAEIQAWLVGSGVQVADGASRRISFAAGISAAQSARRR